MEYSFDIDDAVEFGLNEAVMIKNFKFWIAKNKANGKHEHDGRTWTYNTRKAFCELFPFWSDEQIKRILKSLRDKKILITGNYNQMKYDRTTWYAFNDEKHFIDCLIQPNPLGEITQPIPDNKPDNKTYNTCVNQINQSNDCGSNKELEEYFNLFWLKYPRKLNKKNSLKCFKTALKKTDFNNVLVGLDKYISHIEKNKTEEKYIKHASTWLNGECWNDVYEDVVSDDFGEAVEERIKNGD